MSPTSWFIHAWWQFWVKSDWQPTGWDWRHVMGMALAEWDREHRLYVGSLNFPCKFLSLLQLYFMKHLLCSKHCRKSRGGVARLYGVEVRDFLAGRKHTGVMMSGVSLLVQILALSFYQGKLISSCFNFLINKIQLIISMSKHCCI